MATVNSPLLQLLERNCELFAGKRVLFVGALYDPTLLQLTKECARAQVLCDSFTTAKAMAAMLGQRLESKLMASATLKHISVHFAPRQLFTPKECDIICLLLDKTKAVNQALLAALTPYLAADGLVLAAAANDAGGKSADGYLKGHGICSKLDSARKCTLWQLHFDKATPFAAPANALVLSAAEKATVLQALQDHTFPKLDLSGKPCLEVPLFDHPLVQDCQVFSPMRVDEGTILLLDALHEAPALPQGTALDLCCGCGIVGLQLLQQGFAVSASDDSAAALLLTALNYGQSGSTNIVSVQPSDMLKDLPEGVRYDIIAVNPPFHQGVKTDSTLSRSLFNTVAEHLAAQGSLVLVGNTFLQYEHTLRNYFALVKDLRRTTRFAVQRAAQPL